MNLFHKGPSPFQTPLAMIGAKAGDSVLIMGGADPELSAELARVTGLNGLTIVVEHDPDVRARVDAAARKAGALVELESDAAAAAHRAPAGAFDLAIVVRLGPVAAADRATIVKGAFGAVRRGGRLLVLEGARQGGLLGALRARPPAESAQGIVQLLEQAGGRAVRHLADAGGVSYYETRKP